MNSANNADNAAPTLGIVVPNYNGGRFLRDCLESVVHSNAQVVFMDACSTDDSLAIAREYGDRIQIVSEKDEGQADAIDKGFRLLTTPWKGWLNSDDVFMPGALQRIEETVESVPETVVMVHGSIERTDVHGRIVTAARGRKVCAESMIRGGVPLMQQGSFYRAETLDKVGGVDKSFYLTMDADLWIRLLLEGDAHFIPETLAQFRLHEAAKSSENAEQGYYAESARLAQKYSKHIAAPQTNGTRTTLRTRIERIVPRRTQLKWVHRLRSKLNLLDPNGLPELSSGTPRVFNGVVGFLEAQSEGLSPGCATTAPGRDGVADVAIYAWPPRVSDWPRVLSSLDGARVFVVDPDVDEETPLPPSHLAQRASAWVADRGHQARLLALGVHPARIVTPSEGAAELALELALGRLRFG